MCICNVATYVILFLEYDFLIRHSKLCNTITHEEIDTFLLYFEEKRIISPSDHQEIKAVDKPNEKKQKFMITILATLEVGNTEKFFKVLAILEQHGNQATRILAIEMREKLSM